MASRKPPQKKSSAKKPFLAGLGIILVAIVVLSALELTNVTHLLHHPTATVNEADTPEAHAKKEATINNGGVPTNDDTSDNKESTPGTYAPPTTNEGIRINPSRSSAQVIVNTELVGYSDGICTLTVTNSSKTDSQTANVIYAPDFSTCAGFTIPINNLGTGAWTIKLSVLSGGSTTEKTVTYEVR